MPTDLHFICKSGDGLKNCGDGLFETEAWSVADDIADEAVGGKIYLHKAQKAPAWHGGTILGWRSTEGRRKIFVYKRDTDIQVLCPGNWGREKAIVRR